MSTEITPFQAGVIPDYIRKQAPSELMERLKKNLNVLKRISIRAKVFRLIVGGDELSKNTEGYLDVVMVNVSDSVSRMYYEGAYDPSAEASAPPRCWSADAKTPSLDVVDPLSSTCEACAMNIKGSGTGANNKACRFRRRTAVALAHDLESGVYQLELPAASIFGVGDASHMAFDQYLKFLASHNVNINNVITRLSFDDEADAPKICFSVLGFPAESALPQLEELSKSPEAALAVRLTVYIPNNAPAVNAAPALAAPKITEPTVRETVPAAKPEVDGQDLSDILSKFGSRATAVSDTDDE